MSTSTLAITLPTPLDRGVVNNTSLIENRVALVSKFQELFPGEPEEKIKRAAEELLTGIIANPRGPIIRLRRDYLISYFDRSDQHQGKYFRERAEYVFNAVFEGAVISCDDLKNYRSGTRTLGQRESLERNRARASHLLVKVMDPSEGNTPGCSPEMTVESSPSGQVRPPLHFFPLSTSAPAHPPTIGGDYDDLFPRFSRSTQKVVEALHSFRQPVNLPQPSSSMESLTSLQLPKLQSAGLPSAWISQLTQNAIEAIHSFQHSTHLERDPSKFPTATQRDIERTRNLSDRTYYSETLRDWESDISSP